MTVMTVKQCRDAELSERGDFDDNTPMKTIKAREISSSDSDSDSDSDKKSIEQNEDNEENEEATT